MLNLTFKKGSHALFADGWICGTTEDASVDGPSVADIKKHGALVGWLLLGCHGIR